MPMAAVGASHHGVSHHGHVQQRSRLWRRSARNCEPDIAAAVLG